MSANLANQQIAAPLRLLAETAALFRQECSGLDHLVEELYRDVERLRDELIQKGDDLANSQRALLTRQKQLVSEQSETARLAQLLEQHQARLIDATSEIKSLREQSAKERDESRQREDARFTLLEQKLRAVECERDQLRHEAHVLQVAAATGDGSGNVESLAPLLADIGDLRRQLSETQSQLSESRQHLAATIQQSAASAPAAPDHLPAFLAELGEMRRQLTDTQAQVTEARQQLTLEIKQSAVSPAAAADPLPTLMAELGEVRRQVTQTQDQLGQTQSQLGETRTQLAEAIERAAAAVASASPAAAHEGAPVDEDVSRRLTLLERERNDLESELELVRTRATELQEVVNQQRRELVEQRADITTELRLLRELVAQQPRQPAHDESEENAVLAGTPASSEPLAATPDPVVSSVMAQFARLQKDVALRRKKK